MATIRLTLSGKHILTNPTSRLNAEWGRYLDATRAAGASFDAGRRCQTTHDTRLHDLITSLNAAGFEVEVDEKIHAKMERAKATAAAETEIARALHDEAVTRMNAIDAELALKGLALYPYQKDGVRWLSHRTGAGLFDEMGLGKLQSVDSLVLTPGGWTRIGDLRVDDPVTGSDGQGVTVAGVFPQGRKPVFRVTFSDGSSTLAGAGHLWTVRYRRGGKVWQDLTLTTEQLRLRPAIPQTFRWKAKGTKATSLDLSRTTLYLPMLSGPALFSDNTPLPVPPYTMGALIANGGLAHGTPNLTTNENDAGEVLDRIRKERIEISPEMAMPGCIRVTLRGIKADIRELGLDVLSRIKFIPRRYFTAAPEDRVALLQGLMDADGSITPRKNRVVYHTTSRQLALDVQGLVECLGGVASIREYDRSAESKPLEFQVRMRLPVWAPPFSVKRKADRYRPGSHAWPSRTVASVTPEGEAECVCIAVDAADHLYVTEHAILTHNTVQALISAPKDAPILVVAPSAVKGVWLRETRRWRPDIGFPMILSGRNSFRWPQPGEMVITNYDILVEPENIGDDEHPRYALPSWLPPPKNKTLLILDECHALKNPVAKRTIATRLISSAVRDHGGATWGLTGTPLLNRPKELWHVLRVLGVAESAYGSWKLFKALFRQVARQNSRGDVIGWVEEPRPEVAEKLRKASLMRRRLEVLPDLPTKTYRTVEVPIDSDTKALADKIVTKLAAAGLDLANVRDVAEIVAATKNTRLTLGEISAVRAALAKAKTPKLLELVEEYEAEGKPVVVFSAHRGPVDLIAQRPTWGRITGDEAGLRRTEIVNEFAGGSMAGIACTIRAAGVGIDGLQRASHEAIFCDLDWTPGMNQQAEDRVCRIGQDRGVIITILVADHLLDRKVNELLAQKTRIIEGAVNASARGSVEDQFPDAAFKNLPAVKVRSQKEAEDQAEADSQVPLPNLFEMFRRAVSAGLSRPTIKLIDFSMAMAGNYSNYQGQIHVTNGLAFGAPDNLWYGRIKDGFFYTSTKCTPEVVERMKRWDADPMSLVREAIAYAHNTGVCGFCGLELTDARSVTVGYGPICATNWSLPYPSSAPPQTTRFALSVVPPCE